MAADWANLADSGGKFRGESGPRAGAVDNFEVLNQGKLRLKMAAFA